jgi:hypothetical protein
MVQSQPRQTVEETLSQKLPNTKRANRIVQVVEHLPSKYEALCSNTSTGGKKSIEGTIKEKRNHKYSQTLFYFVCFLQYSKVFYVFCFGFSLWLTS